MKLILKERILSWFDSFNVYDESGDIVFRVKGKLSWGHKLVICDAAGKEIAMVREKIIDLLPHFDLYKDGKKVGTVSKKLTLLRPKFKVDFNGWNVDGNWMEWDYSIRDRKGHTAALVYRKLLRLVDTYVIDVADEADTLDALLVVLAIDAEKCTKDRREEKEK